jgi:hypothetical protein
VPNVNARGAPRLLLAYYLATPLFVVLDLVAGINLRTTFLDGAPALKAAYYAASLGCGAAIARWPARAALIGLLESGTNIGLLILGVGLAYLRVLDAALADTPLPPVFTTASALNLALSAVVLGTSYVGAMSRWRGR